MIFKLFFQAGWKYSLYKLPYKFDLLLKVDFCKDGRCGGFQIKGKML